MIIPFHGTLMVCDQVILGMLSLQFYLLLCGEHKLLRLILSLQDY